MNALAFRIGMLMFVISGLLCLMSLLQKSCVYW